MSKIPNPLYHLILICLGALLVACDGSSSGGGESDIDDAIEEIENISQFDPAAPFVRARQSVEELSPGDSFTIEIGSDNFPGNQGGGITIRFDADVLRIDSVSVDPVWDFAVSAGEIDNAAGEVRDIMFSSFDHPGGASGILTLNATALSRGVSDLVVVESAKNPFAGGGRRFDVQFVDGRVEVN